MADDMSRDDLTNLATGYLLRELKTEFQSLGLTREAREFQKLTRTMELTTNNRLELERDMAGFMTPAMTRHLTEVCEETRVSSRATLRNDDQRIKKFRKEQL